MNFSFIAQPMTSSHTDYDLSAHNTFGMKVLCARFVEYSSVKDLESIDWEELPKPVVSIGEGSNILFTGDFGGTILHSAIDYVKYFDVGLDEVPIMVGAGVKVDSLIEKVCSEGLWGLENLSLIPGEAGASVVQNIGAYGVEIKDVVSGVTCFDLQEKKMCKFRVQDCGFAYRDSLFKRADGRYIVTSILMRLSRKARPRLEYKALAEVFAGRMPETPMQVREEVIKIRRSKLPDPARVGSAGSFFKNPVVSAAQFAGICEGYDSVPHYLLAAGMVKLSAAWLIEQCGLKGCGVGGAAVWEKQPLVLVNASGKASPEDVLALEEKIISAVRARFGVELSPEVVHL